MKKILFTLFLLSSIVLNAQYYESKTADDRRTELSNKSFWERVHFGGGLSASFGSFTSVLVAPTALYDFTNNFKAGIGANYIYINQKVLLNNSEASLKSSVYGGKVLAYYFPFEQFLLSGEFEHNYRTASVGDITYDPYWKSAFFVGVGYMVPLGERGGIILSFSYDLLYDENLSYFASPFRPGIAIYF